MESVVEKSFYEYLLSLGFPSSAVVYEPAFKPTADGRRFRPDFAVLDPTSREILAIIELKSSGASGRISAALKQVSDYTAQLQDPSVRAYVATPAADGNFTFYQTSEDGTPKEVDPSFVRASSLASAKSAEKKEVLAQKKKRTVDGFFVVCYFTAAGALLVAVADFVLEQRGITVLTAERLTLLAAAAGLVIVPYLQKFKALGVEIERQGGGTNG